MINKKRKPDTETKGKAKEKTKPETTKPEPVQEEKVPEEKVTPPIKEEVALTPTPTPTPTPETKVVPPATVEPPAKPKPLTLSVSKRNSMYSDTLIQTLTISK